MGAEENYLDKLLKAVTDPEAVEETEAEETMSLTDDETQEEPVPVTEESIFEAETESEEKTEEADKTEITDVIETADPVMTEEAGHEEAEPETEDELNIDEIASEMSDELSIDDIEPTGTTEVTEDFAMSTPDEFHIEDIDMGALDSIEEPEAAVSDALTLEEPEPADAEDATLEETDSTILDELVSEANEPEAELPDVAEAEPEVAAEEVSDALEPGAELPDVAEVEPEIPNANEPETEILDEMESEAELPEAVEAEPEAAEEEVPDALEPEISDDLRLGELDLDELRNDEISEMSNESDVKAEDKLGEDGELEDVLSMLDDDADLAEINDILKKSDSKEPVQDEMMDLLNQMADDEAELVNAGVKDIVEDDGVPLPEMPVVRQMPTNPEGPEIKENEKKKKKKNEDKAPGAVGKFFNMLTEDLPGPTEEEYAAEDEAKAAKKQEAKEKKEQDKAAKDEEKKAKAEEKAAAKKAKADAAAQKKKEKDAAKAAKAEAKKAKQQAEAIKRAKRIPPKKIVAVAVFGASVFGAVAVSTTILSNQGYINVARRAFYDGDYKSAYLSTYGMELKDSDGLIQARSEVIMKIQCWYDSYQNNLKLNRQREALDALLHGVASYDYINAEAEQYGVLGEVDGIKNTILNVLETEYGLDEAQVKELLSYEDALAYTMALNDIITGE